MVEWVDAAPQYYAFDILVQDETAWLPAGLDGAAVGAATAAATVQGADLSGVAALLPRGAVGAVPRDDFARPVPDPGTAALELAIKGPASHRLDAAAFAGLDDDEDEGNTVDVDARFAPAALLPAGRRAPVAGLLPEVSSAPRAAAEAEPAAAFALTDAQKFGAALLTMAALASAASAAAGVHRRRPKTSAAPPREAAAAPLTGAAQPLPALLASLVVAPLLLAGVVLSPPLPQHPLQPATAAPTRPDNNNAAPTSAAPISVAAPAAVPAPVSAPTVSDGDNDNDNAKHAPQPRGRGRGRLFWARRALSAVGGALVAAAGAAVAAAR